MPYNAQQRRNALATFMAETGLQPKEWARRSGLSESALWPFMKSKTQALGDDTYELLAVGASKILKRPIRAATLRGEPPVAIEIPIGHYVGAGDEVHLFDGDDSTVDWTGAPPGFEKGAAAIVRGDSMRPMYDDGDILFYLTQEPPPPVKDLPQRPVIVQVKDGPIFVKRLLPGTKRGRYHLLSLNPLTPLLQDQPVLSIARIGWVKPRQ